MLDQQDKKDIQNITAEVIKEVMPPLLEDFARETINPSFQGMQDQMNGLQDQMSGLKEDIQQRPTIAQIDVKLQNMETRLKEDLGEKPLERDRVLNTKTDTVAIRLEEKHVFDSADTEVIRRIAPIAVSPAP